MSLEPWLRSPLPHIIDELQPVAAMFIAAKEDIQNAVDGLTPEAIWSRVNGTASIGFHMIHLAGATDRLLSYAEGMPLNDAQKAALVVEREVDDVRPPIDALMQGLTSAFDHAVKRLEGVTVEELAAVRELGRAKVPTTMRSLILHAGEHASRHAGQIVTTSKILDHRA